MPIYPTPRLLIILALSVLVALGVGIYAPGAWAWAFLWALALLLLPLFNKQHARLGDFLAGTRVVHMPKAALSYDLVNKTVDGLRERHDADDFNALPD